MKYLVSLSTLLSFAAAHGILKTIEVDGTLVVQSFCQFKFTVS
jgi:hypothetical protein